MELGEYVSDLQRQLVDAAENGTEETRAVAERLAAGLDAATRLVLLDVLSAAVGEITRDLAPGSVDMRLRGREVEFVVTQPNPEPDNDERPAATADLDDASTSRTTLRLPDALKARVDEAAAADGLSVNTWLVRAVAAGLQPKQRRSAQRTLRTGDNFAGWAR
jgi:predicted transcriptional regulator